MDCISLIAMNAFTLTARVVTVGKIEMFHTASHVSIIDILSVNDERRSVLSMT